MLMLDSLQLLDAVKRSLNSHVLPALEDEFAQVQVAAAIKVLEEVSERIAQGDPCERLNQALRDDVRALSITLHDDSVTVRDALLAALEVSAAESAREQNRQLVENLWKIAAQSDGLVSTRLTEILNQRGIEAAVDDSRWLCREALLSLA